ncbi:MAG: cytidine deaminase [Clostridia bacterium]|nr:cytidine deaminase [Clostridia bacterium]
MEEKTITDLIEQALSARKNSYAPYSKFRVGAALLDAKGNVYTGVNVENVSYPAGICAERTAIAKAVSEGASDFTAIAIVGGSADRIDILGSYCTPCGICRQVLYEHCSGDLMVIIARSVTDYRLCTLRELLPFAFGMT